MYRNKFHIKMPSENVVIFERSEGNINIIFSRTSSELREQEAFEEELYGAADTAREPGETSSCESKLENPGSMLQRAAHLRVVSSRKQEMVAVDLINLAQRLEAAAAFWQHARTTTLTLHEAEQRLRDGIASVRTESPSCASRCGADITWAPWSSKPL